MAVLEYLTHYLHVREAYLKGLTSEEDFNECKKQFYVALSEFIDFRLRAIIEEQERKYNIEIEARMEAHERAMATVAPILELDLDLTEDEDNSLK